MLQSVQVVFFGLVSVVFFGMLSDELISFTLGYLSFEYTKERSSFRLLGFVSCIRIRCRVGVMFHAFHFYRSSDTGAGK